MRPHLEYGMKSCSPNLVVDMNHLERIQRLLTGERHLPHEEWLQWLAVPCSDNGWPDYNLQDIHEPFGYWSEIAFPPSWSTPPKGSPLQGTPGCGPPPKDRSGISGDGCEIHEKGHVFHRYSPFCRCFQEKVGESLDRSLSPSNPLMEHSSPHLPTLTLHHTCTPPINNFHLHMLPNSMFCICGFFRLVVDYF